MDEGGLLDQSKEPAGHRARDEALEAAGSQAADRPTRRGRGDRRRHRLPLLGARLLRRRRRLVGRRRHRPGDHLSGERYGARPISGAGGDRRRAGSGAGAWRSPS